MDVLWQMKCKCKRDTQREENRNGRGRHRVTLLKQEKNGKLKDLKTFRGISAIQQEDFEVESVEEQARKRRKLVLILYAIDSISFLNRFSVSGGVKPVPQYF